MTLTELLGNIGLLGGTIMFSLAALSLFSVGMIIDKYRRLSMAAKQSQVFKPAFKKFLHSGDVQELIDAVRKHASPRLSLSRRWISSACKNLIWAGRDPPAWIRLG